MNWHLVFMFIAFDIAFFALGYKFRRRQEKRFRKKMDDKWDYFLLRMAQEESKKSSTE